MSPIQSHSGKTKVALGIGGAGILAVCIVWSVKVLSPPKDQNLLNLNNKDTVTKGQDSVHLNTLAAPDGVRRHLLDADFTTSLEEFRRNRKSPFQTQPNPLNMGIH
jgi:hypothetical protein